MSKTKGYALITGASKRIGRAFALGLAENGWDIVVHCNKSIQEATSLSEEIRAKGRKAHLAPCDLSDESEVNLYMEKVTKAIGPVIVLINNASMFERDTYDPDGSLHNFINTTSPRILSESLSSLLPETCNGNIINLLDSTPIPSNFSAYSKSKQALAELTRELAIKYAPRIRVNGISPGPTLINSRQSYEHFAKLVEFSPIRTAVSVEALTTTAIFLLNNPFITGQVINVDGGTHLLMQN